MNTADTTYYSRLNAVSTKTTTTLFKIMTILVYTEQAIISFSFFPFSPSPLSDCGKYQLSVSVCCHILLTTENDSEEGS